VSTAAPFRSEPAESLDSKRAIRALRAMFSFPVMLACLLIALAVFTARTRLNDPDTWWHLRTGQVIWSTHIIPTMDLFSYTAYHQRLLPHEWLPEVFIYLAYHFLGGYTGLMLWLCSATALLLIAGYLLCWLYSGNAKVSFLGALTIWFFATIGIAIRPQMVGYLLLIVELLLLQLGRTRSPRWFLALPPLFLLWINCHASFFLGLIVAAAVLFCSFFDFRAGSLAAVRWDRGRQLTLGLALAISGAAIFLNPTGWRQVVFPLDLLRSMPVSVGYIDEFVPLQMNSARGVGLLAILALIALLLIVQRAELYWDELTLLVIGAGLALHYTRMLFVFGILTAPILSRLLAGSWDNYDPRYDRPPANAVLIATTLLAAVLGFPSSRALTAQVEAANPVKAVEFIQAHHLAGNMLNEYVYGGYLIWAAPQHPVFVDGRAEIYEWTGVLPDFANWILLRSNPRTLLKKYNISFCLLRRNSPMAHVLPLLPGWKMVFSGAKSVIFVRSPESGG